MGYEDLNNVGVDLYKRYVFLGKEINRMAVQQTRCKQIGKKYPDKADLDAYREELKELKKLLGL